MQRQTEQVNENNENMQIKKILGNVNIAPSTPIYFYSCTGYLSQRELKPQLQLEIRLW